MDKTSCIILAGGESKRFGEDKAFFNFKGKSFLERALDTAMETCGDVAISVRDESRIKDYLAEAKSVVRKRAAAGKKNAMPKIIADAGDNNCGFRGPLRGIYTSVNAVKGQYALVTECDAPFFNSNAAKELIEKLEEENVSAVVPLWPDSAVEPLLAVYKIKETVFVLEMLNNYALNLKEYFLFTDSVNIGRFLSSVYYYNIFEASKNNNFIKPEFFININSKKEIKAKNAGLDAEAVIAGKKHNGPGLKSVKIRKTNRFYDIKNPVNKPYGILARALYYWWVYAKTGNLIYFKKSFECFKKDGSIYDRNNLNFIGSKIVKTLQNTLASAGLSAL